MTTTNAMRAGLERYRAEQRAVAIRTVRAYRDFLTAEADAIAAHTTRPSWADVTVPTDAQYALARDAGAIT